MAVRITGEDLLVVEADSDQRVKLEAVKHRLVNTYQVPDANIRIEPLGVGGNATLELVARVPLMRTYEQQILADVNNIMDWPAPQA